VASCAVFVPAAAVGARGSPVSVGELDSTTVAVPVVLISSTGPSPAVVLPERYL
jgi:hypothetical protein